MLSNADYNDSKKILLESINNVPIITLEYMISRYCKISIGKEINTKEMFILKPKDIIKIKWKVNEDNLECLKMIINNIEYDLYWKNDKIISWLDKNARNYNDYYI